MEGESARGNAGEKAKNSRLKDEDSASSSNGVVGSEMSVLPHQTVVLLVHANDVVLVQRGAVPSDEIAIKVLAVFSREHDSDETAVHNAHETKAITSELEAVGGDTSSHIAQIESLLAVERGTGIG